MTTMSTNSGNAFTNPSSGKIDQQRKILEELERKKKQINQSPTSSMASSTVLTNASPSASSATAETSPVLSNNQRVAMELATKSSFGFFVPQDSSFGNLILPVIPRISEGNQ